MTAFIPISVREAGNMQMNIQTIGMVGSLASDIEDPIKRLHAIHESTQKAKYLTDTLKPALLGWSLPWGTPIMAHGLMNIFGRYHMADRLPPFANLTISNVALSPIPLFLAGAKVVANYPISIPVHGSALNITVQSYCDNFDMGLTACRHTVPDVRKIGDYMVAALAELKAATLKHHTEQQVLASAPAPADESVAPKKKRRAAAKPASDRKARNAAKPSSSKVPKAPRVLTAQNNPVDGKKPVSGEQQEQGSAATNVVTEASVAKPSIAGNNGSDRRH